MCEEIDKVIKEALSKYMSWENILKGQNNIKITRLWWIMQSVFFFLNLICRKLLKEKV